ncbi:MAG: hypothetical protein QXV17_10590 [Candidatus Micrarchaeaceae archaeon]
MVEQEKQSYDISMIAKKLAYIAIQFNKIGEGIRDSRPRAARESNLLSEEHYVLELITPNIWWIRKLLLRIDDPDVDDNKKEEAKRKIKDTFTFLRYDFNALLERNEDLELRFPADDKRKERYLELKKELDNVKEIIEKTVLV